MRRVELLHEAPFGRTRRLESCARRPELRAHVPLAAARRLRQLRGEGLALASDLRRALRCVLQLRHQLGLALRRRVGEFREGGLMLRLPLLLALPRVSQLLLQ